MKRPSDFQQFMGSPVLLKTYKPVNGRKEFAGKLAGYDNGAVELDMGTAQPLRFEKAGHCAGAPACGILSNDRKNRSYDHEMR